MVKKMDDQILYTLETFESVQSIDSSTGHIFLAIHFWQNNLYKVLATLQHFGNLAFLM
jgi:hypothetical protein